MLLKIAARLKNAPKQKEDLEKLLKVHDTYSQTWQQVLPAIKGLANAVQDLACVPDHYFDRLVEMASDDPVVDAHSLQGIKTLKERCRAGLDHLGSAQRAVGYQNVLLRRLDHEVEEIKDKGQDRAESR